MPCLNIVSRKILSALFGLAYIGIGQTPALAETPEVLSFQQCLGLREAIKLSVNRDASILIARGVEAQAEADLTDARSLYRPSFSAFGRSGIGDVGAVDNNVSNQVGLRASQRIFDFGDAKLARQTANANRLATVQESRAVSAEVSLESSFLWLAFNEASEQIDLTKEREGYLQSQLTAIDSALRVGGATRTERATVASRLADAKSFRLELEFRQLRARTQLEVNTGSSAVPCSDSNYIEDKAVKLALADDVVNRALSNNPEISALRRRVEASEADRTRRGRARLPIISVVATGSYGSLGGFDNFEFRDRLGVDVTIPLYAGGGLSADNKRAGAQNAISKGQLLDRERAVESEVRIAMTQVQSLREQIKARENVEYQSRLQFEAAEIEYAAGTQTVRDLIEIRLEFEAASLERVRAEYDLLRQQAQLLSLLGPIDNL